MNDGLDNQVILDDGSVAWDVGKSAPVTRFGWDAMRKFGRQLCRLVNSVRPLIIKGFGDNALVVALLDLIDALCPLIENVASQYADGNQPVAPENTKQDLLVALQNIQDKLNSTGGA